MKKILFAIIFFVSLNQNIWADQTPGQNNGGSAKLELATFAGGCFWCMVHPFEELPGVKSVVSGYTGGQKENPAYHEVSSGSTGHCESVQVTFDPAQVTYEKLLDVFWHNIDPTTLNKEFNDEGTQYRTAIFYHNEDQKQLAEESKKTLDAKGVFGKPIVTEITAASKFYPAEDYHQDFYKTHPYQYKFYRFNSGRDQYLDRIWGKDRAQ